MPQAGFKTITVRSDAYEILKNVAERGDISIENVVESLTYILSKKKIDIKELLRDGDELRSLLNAKSALRKLVLEDALTKIFLHLSLTMQALELINETKHSGIDSSQAENILLPKYFKLKKALITINPEVVNEVIGLVRANFPSLNKELQKGKQHNFAKILQREVDLLIEIVEEEKEKIKDDDFCSFCQWLLQDLAQVKSYMLAYGMKSK